MADQTNACLQEAVRKDGKAYVQHLDSFIVALREELDSPGGVNARNPPAIERRPYRMDVKHDGTGKRCFIIIIRMIQPNDVLIQITNYAGLLHSKSFRHRKSGVVPFIQ